MQRVNTLDGERSSGDRVVRTAWYDKIGPTEVINRTVWRHGAVFGRVTPRRAHRTGERRFAQRSKINPVSRRVPLFNPVQNSDILGTPSKARRRYVEKIAEQVRSQAP